MAGGSSVTPVRYDLAQFAAVTTVISATQFIAAGLNAFTSGTFVGYSVWVLSKIDGSSTPPKGEAPKLISAFDGRGSLFPILPGTVTHPAFTTSLVVGDQVLLLNPAVARAFQTATGITPTPGGSTLYGSTTANWQAAEQDLLNIGVVTPGTAVNINSLVISIANLIGNITIRMYVTVNGTERRIFPIPAATTVTAAMAPAIPVINGTWTFPGRLRVTIQSDNAADNGQAVDYEVM